MNKDIINLVIYAQSKPLYMEFTAACLTAANILGIEYNHVISVCTTNRITDALIEEAHRTQLNFCPQENTNGTHIEF